MSFSMPSFNVRVYAIILNEQQQVLLTDEYQMDMKMTKFPGGGLQYGEGTIDCLHREAHEEFGQDLEITGHFYTLDYFQPSLFNSQHQLLSIYYKARFPEPVRFKTTSRPFDGASSLQNGFISFRWKSVRSLTPDDFTLPVDKKVAEMIAR